MPRSHTSNYRRFGAASPADTLHKRRFGAATLHTIGDSVLTNPAVRFTGDLVLSDPAVRFTLGD